MEEAHFLPRWLNMEPINWHCGRVSVMPSVDILTHQSHIYKVGQHNLANITSALQRLVTLKLSIIIKHYYDNNNVSENQSRIRLLNFSWHLCRSMKFEFSITLRTLRIMAKLSEFVAKYLFALFYQFLITSMRVNTCNTIFNVECWYNFYEGRG